MILNWEILQKLLIIAICCSTVTVAFIQKTKKFCKNNKCITTYSFVVNMIFGFFFSRTFTDLDYIKSIWVGLFSFIGADTIYRNLEGKLSSYTSLRSELENTKKQETETSKTTPVEKLDTKNEIIGEIYHD